MNDISLTHRGEADAACLGILAPFGLPADIDPVTWRKAIRQRIDSHLDDVDALLMALDAMTGDPDLEPSDDGESSLGWVGNGPTSYDSGDDREVDNSDWEEDGDFEPSLAAPEIPPTYYVQGGSRGWTELQGSQERWAKGSTGDGENNVEDEGEAVNEDGDNILDEPHDMVDEGNEETEGWSLHIDQTIARNQAFGWAV